MSSHRLPNAWRTTLALASLICALPMVHAQSGKSHYTFLNPTPRDQMRELSTDRPDQTESPYTVDAGHFQVELDFFNYARRDFTEGSTRWREEAYAITPLNLKAGLTNTVDLQLMVDPSVTYKLKNRETGSTQRLRDVGDVTVRLKYNLWGNDGGRTAFALMPFVKLPLDANEVRNGETEGGLMAILGFSLNEQWSGAFMTEVDLVSNGSGHDTEWINSITFARGLTQRVGAYLEFFTVVSDAPGYDWQGQVDAGFTYALSDDSQLDFGCNFGVTDSAPDYQPFIGFSQRF